MDKVLPYFYGQYGQYSNFRNFPLDIDGLKPVERRVLLAAYKISRGGFVKSRQIGGYTIGHYHPHGDVYGTIVQLVKQGFLDGQGNFGTDVGVEEVSAAADRYTECKINKLSLDMLFKYYKYVPQIDTDLNDVEPEYLPTMFPVCLMGKAYTIGIGFGFRTFVPCFDIKDLYQRLLFLLGMRKTKPTIAPITDCKIISPKSELETLLTTGKAKIDVEGIIEENKLSSSLILRSWPPGRKFEVLLKKFSGELDGGMIGWRDASSQNKTEIIFQVLRERNRSKIYDDFVVKLKENLVGSISFETIIVDSNKNVATKSVDEMLVNTFDMFCKTNTEMATQEMSKLKEQINEFKILEIIREPLSNCISNRYEIEEAIKAVSSLTEVPVEMISQLIEKYKIRKLLTLVTDTNDLEQKVKDYQNILSDIKTFVLEQYNATVQ